MTARQGRQGGGFRPMDSNQRRDGKEMASTKFISKVQDDELTGHLFDAVKADEDRLIKATVDRSTDGHSPFNVMLEFETRFDGEDEDSILQDTYEVDDYDVVPFDWGGSTSEAVLAWRRWLFGKFGAEYAEWHLVGHLAETAEKSRSWSLDA